MSSTHNPIEKKRLSFARDHYSKPKYDKARNAWRRKEKSIERAYRHKVKMKVVALNDGDFAAMLSKKKVRKWPVAKLGEEVKNGLSKRTHRVGSRIRRQAAQ